MFTSGRFLRVGLLGLVTAVGSLSSTAPVAGQADVFADVIHVRRVTVDVVVTDNKGRPVRGLEAARFELRVGGEGVPIVGFSEVDVGAGVESGLEVTLEVSSEEHREAGSELESRPLLVILVDGQSLLPEARTRLLEDVVGALDRLLAGSRAVLVASIGRRLEIDQPATRDPELLIAALHEIGARSSVRRPADSGLLRDIEDAQELAPEGQLASQMTNELARRQARALMAEIRSSAMVDRHKTTSVSQQLRDLVLALGTLPGRSCVLFLSEGLTTLPGEVAYRMWWSKYGRLGSEMGLASIEAEIGREDSSGEIQKLLEGATANRVTFYSVGLGSSLRRGATAEFRTGAVLDAEMASLSDPRDALATLADGSGGVAARYASRGGHVLDTLASDLGHYYSLAFDPDSVSGERGRVRVRVDGSGLKTRSLRRYRQRPEDEEIQNRVYAALHLDVAENLHGLAIELGDPEPTRGGDFLLPLQLKVPLAELTLLPQEDRHVGRLTVALAARGDEGGSSPGFLGHIPVEISNSDLLRAMGSSVSCDLQLRVAGGTQKLAVALRDDLDRSYSTFNLTVEVGR